MKFCGETEHHTMSGARALLVIADTGTDVLCGLNFLRVDISLPDFLDHLLDSIGGEEEKLLRYDPDPIWGYMAILIIFLPGVVYACIALSDLFEGNEGDKIEIPEFTRGESDQTIDEELGLSIKDINDKTKGNNNKLKLQMKILDIVSFVFFFPLAFITHCIWWVSTRHGKKINDTFQEYIQS